MLFYQRVCPDHAALVHGRQDGELVVVGPAESSPVVQMERIRPVDVAEHLERLVVVAVHVAHL